MTARHRLERRQLVPQPLDRVFAFFADAGNLEAITPPFLRFEILTPRPVAMAAGTRIDYRLTLFAFRFGWRTRIVTFEPGVGFTDVQEQGPYRSWHHRHAFLAAPGGTIVHDIVDYALPFGPAGALAHMLFVRRTLRRIFDHRQARIAELLGRA